MKEEEVVVVGSDPEEEEEEEDVVVVSSDSEDDDETVWKRKTNNKHYQVLFEKVKPIMFHHVSPEYKSTNFPYTQFKELADYLKKAVALVNAKSNLAFIWKNLLRWIVSMKLCYEVDLNKDRIYKFILTDFMSEYVNYKCKLHKAVTDEAEICCIVDNIVVTLGLVFNGDIAGILMTLLKIQVVDEYRLILDPLFRNYLSQKNLHEPNELISYLRLILCYRQWKKLAHLKEDKEVINEIAVGKSEKALRGVIDVDEITIDPVLPKSVPPVNEENRSFASITGLIGFASRNKAYGTRILLINKTLELEDTIEEYLRRYKEFIQQSSTKLFEPRRSNIEDLTKSPSPLPDENNENSCLKKELHQKNVQTTNNNNNSNINISNNSNELQDTEAVNQHLSKNCDNSSISINNMFNKLHVSSHTENLSPSCKQKTQIRKSDVALSVKEKNVVKLDDTTDEDDNNIVVNAQGENCTEESTKSNESLTKLLERLKTHAVNAENKQDGSKARRTSTVELASSSDEDDPPVNIPAPVQPVVVNQADRDRNQEDRNEEVSNQVERNVEVSNQVERNVEVRNVSDRNVRTPHPRRNRVTHSKTVRLANIQKARCVPGVVSSTTSFDADHVETPENTRDSETPKHPVLLANNYYSDISDEDNDDIDLSVIGRYSKVVEEATSSTNEIAGRVTPSENAIFSVRIHRSRRSVSSSPCPTRPASPYGTFPSSTIRLGRGLDISSENSAIDEDQPICSRYVKVPAAIDINRSINLNTFPQTKQIEEDAAPSNNHMQIEVANASESETATCSKYSLTSKSVFSLSNSKELIEDVNNKQCSSIDDDESTSDLCDFLKNISGYIDDSQDEKMFERSKDKLPPDEILNEICNLASEGSIVEIENTDKNSLEISAKSLIETCNLVCEKSIVELEKNARISPTETTPVTFRSNIEILHQETLFFNQNIIASPSFDKVKNIVQKTDSEALENKVTAKSIEQSLNEQSCSTKSSVALPESRIKIELQDSEKKTSGTIPQDQMNLEVCELKFNETPLEGRSSNGDKDKSQLDKFFKKTTSMKIESNAEKCIDEDTNSNKDSKQNSLNTSLISDEESLPSTKALDESKEDEFSDDDIESPAFEPIRSPKTLDEAKNKTKLASESSMVDSKQAEPVSIVSDTNFPDVEIQNVNLADHQYAALNPMTLTEIEKASSIVVIKESETEFSGENDDETRKASGIEVIKDSERDVRGENDDETLTIQSRKEISSEEHSIVEENAKTVSGVNQSVLLLDNTVITKETPSDAECNMDHSKENNTVKPPTDDLNESVKKFHIEKEDQKVFLQDEHRRYVNIGNIINSDHDYITPTLVDRLPVLSIENKLVHEISLGKLPTETETLTNQSSSIPSTTSLTERVEKEEVDISSIPDAISQEEVSVSTETFNNQTFSGLLSENSLPSIENVEEEEEIEMWPIDLDKIELEEVSFETDMTSDLSPIEQMSDEITEYPVDENNSTTTENLPSQNVDLSSERSSIEQISAQIKESSTDAKKSTVTKILPSQHFDLSSDKSSIEQISNKVKECPVDENKSTVTEILPSRHVDLSSDKSSIEQISDNVRECPVDEKKSTVTEILPSQHFDLSSDKSSIEQTSDKVRECPVDEKKSTVPETLLSQHVDLSSDKSSIEQISDKVRECPVDEKKSTVTEILPSDRAVCTDEKAKSCDADVFPDQIELPEVSLSVLDEEEKPIECPLAEINKTTPEEHKSSTEQVDNFVVNENVLPEKHSTDMEDTSKKLVTSVELLSVKNTTEVNVEVQIKEELSVLELLSESELRLQKDLNTKEQAKDLPTEKLFSTEDLKDTECTEIDEHEIISNNNIKKRDEKVEIASDLSQPDLKGDGANEESPTSDKLATSQAINHENELSAIPKSIINCEDEPKNTECMFPDEKSVVREEENKSHVNVDNASVSEKNTCRKLRIRISRLKSTNIMENNSKMRDSNNVDRKQDKHENSDKDITITKEEDISVKGNVLKKEKGSLQQLELSLEINNEKPTAKVVLLASQPNLIAETQNDLKSLRKSKDQKQSEIVEDTSDVNTQTVSTLGPRLTNQKVKIQSDDPILEKPENPIILAINVETKVETPDTETTKIKDPELNSEAKIIDVLNVEHNTQKLDKSKDTEKCQVKFKIRMKTEPVRKKKKILKKNTSSASKVENRIEHFNETSDSNIVEAQIKIDSEKCEDESVISKAEQVEKAREIESTKEESDRKKQNKAKDTEPKESQKVVIIKEEIVVNDNEEINEGNELKDSLVEGQQCQECPVLGQDIAEDEPTGIKVELVSEEIKNVEDSMEIVSKDGTKQNIVSNTHESLDVSELEHQCETNIEINKECSTKDMDNGEMGKECDAKVVEPIVREFPKKEMISEEKQNECSENEKEIEQVVNEFKGHQMEIEEKDEKHKEQVEECQEKDLNMETHIKPQEKQQKCKEKDMESEVKECVREDEKSEKMVEAFEENKNEHKKKKKESKNIEKDKSCKKKNKVNQGKNKGSKPKDKICSEKIKECAEQEKICQEKTKENEDNEMKLNKQLQKKDKVAKRKSNKRDQESQEKDSESKDVDKEFDKSVKTLIDQCGHTNEDSKVKQTEENKHQVQNQEKSENKLSRNENESIEDKCNSSTITKELKSSKKNDKQSTAPITVESLNKVHDASEIQSGKSKDSVVPILNSSAQMPHKKLDHVEQHSLKSIDFSKYSENVLTGLSEEDLKRSLPQSKVVSNEDDTSNLSLASKLCLASEEGDRSLGFDSEVGDISHTEDQEVSAITSQKMDIPPHSSYDDDNGTPVMDEKDPKDIDSPTIPKQIISLNVLKVPEQPDPVLVPVNFYPGSPKVLPKSTGASHLDNSTNIDNILNFNTKRETKPLIVCPSPIDVSPVRTSPQKPFCEPTARTKGEKVHVKIRLKRRISRSNNEEINWSEPESEGNDHVEDPPRRKSECSATKDEKSSTLLPIKNSTDDFQQSYNEPLNLVTRSDKESPPDGSSIRKTDKEFWLKKRGILKNCSSNQNYDLLSSPPTPNFLNKMEGENSIMFQPNHFTFRESTLTPMDSYYNNEEIKAATILTMLKNSTDEKDRAETSKKPTKSKKITPTRSRVRVTRSASQRMNQSLHSDTSNTTTTEQEKLSKPATKRKPRKGKAKSVEIEIETPVSTCSQSAWQQNPTSEIQKIFSECANNETIMKPVITDLNVPSNPTCTSDTDDSDKLIIDLESRKKTTKCKSKKKPKKTKNLRKDDKASKPNTKKRKSLKTFTEPTEEVDLDLSSLSSEKIAEAYNIFEEEPPTNPKIESNLEVQNENPSDISPLSSKDKRRARPRERLSFSIDAILGNADDSPPSEREKSLTADSEEPEPAVELTMNKETWLTNLSLKKSSKSLDQVVKELSETKKYPEQSSQDACSPEVTESQTSPSKQEGFHIKLSQRKTSKKRGKAKHATEQNDTAIVSEEKDLEFIEKAASTNTAGNTNKTIENIAKESNSSLKGAGVSNGKTKENMTQLDSEVPNDSLEPTEVPKVKAKAKQANTSQIHDEKTLPSLQKSKVQKAKKSTKTQRHSNKATENLFEELKEPKEKETTIIPQLVEQKPESILESLVIPKIEKASDEVQLLNKETGSTLKKSRESKEKKTTKTSRLPHDTTESYLEEREIKIERDTTPENRLNERTETSFEAPEVSTGFTNHPPILGEKLDKPIQKLKVPKVKKSTITSQPFDIKTESSTEEIPSKEDSEESSTTSSYNKRERKKHKKKSVLTDTPLPTDEPSMTSLQETQELMEPSSCSKKSKKHKKRKNDQTAFNETESDTHLNHTTQKSGPKPTKTKTHEENDHLEIEPSKEILNTIKQECLEKTSKKSKFNKEDCGVEETSVGFNTCQKSSKPVKQLNENSSSDKTVEKHQKEIFELKAQKKQLKVALKRMHSAFSKEDDQLLPKFKKRKESGKPFTELEKDSPEFKKQKTNSSTEENLVEHDKVKLVMHVRRLSIEENNIKMSLEKTQIVTPKKHTKKSKKAHRRLSKEFEISQVESGGDASSVNTLESPILIEDSDQNPEESSIIPPMITKINTISKIGTSEENRPKREKNYPMNEATNVSSKKFGLKSRQTIAPEDTNEMVLTGLNSAVITVDDMEKSKEVGGTTKRHKATELDNEIAASIQEPTEIQKLDINAKSSTAAESQVQRNNGTNSNIEASVEVGSTEKEPGPMNDVTALEIKAANEATSVNVDEEHASTPKVLHQNADQMEGVETQEKEKNIKAKKSSNSPEKLIEAAQQYTDKLLRETNELLTPVRKIKNKTKRKTKSQVEELIKEEQSNINSAPVEELKPFIETLKDEQLDDPKTSPPTKSLEVSQDKSDDLLEGATELLTPMQKSKTKCGRNIETAEHQVKAPTISSRSELVEHVKPIIEIKEEKIVQSETNVSQTPIEVIEQDSSELSKETNDSLKPRKNKNKIKRELKKHVEATDNLVKQAEESLIKTAEVQEGEQIEEPKIKIPESTSTPVQLDIKEPPKETNELPKSRKKKTKIEAGLIKNVETVHVVKQIEEPKIKLQESTMTPVQQDIKEPPKETNELPKSRKKKTKIEAGLIKNVETVHVDKQNEEPKIKLQESTMTPVQQDIKEPPKELPKSRMTKSKIEADLIENVETVQVDKQTEEPKIKLPESTMNSTQQSSKAPPKETNELPKSRKTISKIEAGLNTNVETIEDFAILAEESTNEATEVNQFVQADKQLEDEKSNPAETLIEAVQPNSSELSKETNEMLKQPKPKNKIKRGLGKGIETVEGSATEATESPINASSCNQVDVQRQIDDLITNPPQPQVSDTELIQKEYGDLAVLNKTKNTAKRRSSIYMDTTAKLDEKVVNKKPKTRVSSEGKATAKPSDEHKKVEHVTTADPSIESIFNEVKKFLSEEQAPFKTNSIKILIKRQRFSTDCAKSLNSTPVSLRTRSHSTSDESVTVCKETFQVPAISFSITDSSTSESTPKKPIDIEPKKLPKSPEIKTPTKPEDEVKRVLELSISNILGNQLSNRPQEFDSVPVDIFAVKGDPSDKLDLPVIKINPADFIVQSSPKENNNETIEARANKVSEIEDVKKPCSRKSDSESKSYEPETPELALAAPWILESLGLEEQGDSQTTIEDKVKDDKIPIQSFDCMISGKYEHEYDEDISVLLGIPTDPLESESQSPPDDDLYYVNDLFSGLVSIPTQENGCTANSESNTMPLKIIAAKKDDESIFKKPIPVTNEVVEQGFPQQPSTHNYYAPQVEVSTEVGFEILTNDDHYYTSSELEKSIVKIATPCSENEENILQKSTLPLSSNELQPNKEQTISELEESSSQLITAKSPENINNSDKVDELIKSSALLPSSSYEEKEPAFSKRSLIEVENLNTDIKEKTEHLSSKCESSIENKLSESDNVTPQVSTKKTRSNKPSHLIIESKTLSEEENISSPFKLKSCPKPFWRKTTPSKETKKSGNHHTTSPGITQHELKQADIPAQTSVKMRISKFFSSNNETEHEKASSAKNSDKREVPDETESKSAENKLFEGPPGKKRRFDSATSSQKKLSTDDLFNRLKQELTIDSEKSGNQHKTSLETTKPEQPMKSLKQANIPAKTCVKMQISNEADHEKASSTKNSNKRETPDETEPMSTENKLFEEPIPKKPRLDSATRSQENSNPSTDDLFNRLKQELPVNTCVPKKVTITNDPEIEIDDNSAEDSSSALLVVPVTQEKDECNKDQVPSTSSKSFICKESSLKPSESIKLCSENKKILNEDNLSTVPDKSPCSKKASDVKQVETPPNKLKSSETFIKIPSDRIKVEASPKLAFKAEGKYSRISFSDSVTNLPELDPFNLKKPKSPTEPTKSILKSSTPATDYGTQNSTSQVQSSITSPITKLKKASKTSLPTEADAIIPNSSDNVQAQSSITSPIPKLKKSSKTSLSTVAEVSTPNLSDNAQAQSPITSSIPKLKKSSKTSLPSVAEVSIPSLSDNAQAQPSITSPIPKLKRSSKTSLPSVAEVSTANLSDNAQAQSSITSPVPKLKRSSKTSLPSVAEVSSPNLSDNAQAQSSITSPVPKLKRSSKTSVPSVAEVSTPNLSDNAQAQSSITSPIPKLKKSSKTSLPTVAEVSTPSLNDNAKKHKPFLLKPSVIPPPSPSPRVSHKNESTSKSQPYQTPTFSHARDPRAQSPSTQTYRSVPPGLGILIASVTIEVENLANALSKLPTEAHTFPEYRRRKNLTEQHDKKMKELADLKKKQESQRQSFISKAHSERHTIDNGIDHHRSRESRHNLKHPSDSRTQNEVSANLTKSLSERKPIDSEHYHRLGSTHQSSRNINGYQQPYSLKRKHNHTKSYVNKFGDLDNIKFNVSESSDQIADTVPNSKRLPSWDPKPVSTAEIIAALKS